MSWKRWLLVAFALVVINLPFGLHELQQHRAATDGVQVTATVTTVSDAGGGDAVVTFRLPANVDPAQVERSVKVDAATANAVAHNQTIDVRVLEGHPAVFHVDGQVRSWASTVITMVADLLIILIVLLSMRFGGRLRRPDLVAVALGDVESGDEGSLLDRQVDGTYLINGEIKESDPSTLVLALRDREVTVHLRGHHNPVAVGDRAQVLAHLVG